jgi:hypothetical protein
VRLFGLLRAIIFAEPTRRIGPRHSALPRRRAVGSVGRARPNPSPGSRRQSGSPVLFVSSPTSGATRRGSQCLRPSPRAHCYALGEHERADDAGALSEPRRDDPLLEGRRRRTVTPHSRSIASRRPPASRGSTARSPSSCHFSPSISPPPSRRRLRIAPISTRDEHGK